MKAMTEKTFRDMLPLTDEQRDILDRRINKKHLWCVECPLDGHSDSCTVFVGVNKKSTCDRVRAEALRMDDEYRKANMKKDILSQEKFSEKLESITVIGFLDMKDSLIDSHAAALERIAELEKDLSKSEEYIENILLPKITDLESRLAAYEPVHMDAEDEAWKKACDRAREINRGGNVVRIDETLGAFEVSIGGLDTVRFPYARPGKA